MGTTLAKSVETSAPVEEISSNTTYQTAPEMGWCGCQSKDVLPGTLPESALHEQLQSDVHYHVACDEGYMLTGMGLYKISGHHGFEIVPNKSTQSAVTCCRPSSMASTGTDSMGTTLAK